MVQVEADYFITGTLKNKYRAVGTSVGVFSRINVMHFYYRNIAATRHLQSGKTVAIQYIFFYLLFHHCTDQKRFYRL